MWRSKDDRKMLTATAPIRSETLAERVAAVLRREFGDLRCATKRIAQAVNADPRAVRNWWDGINAPQAGQLLTLARICPALRDEIDGLVIEEAPLAERQRLLAAEAARLERRLRELRAELEGGIRGDDGLAGRSAPLARESPGAQALFGVAA